MKKALVLGAGGQAGWYMCQLLLDKGYKVFGTMRPGLESVESPRFHSCSTVQRFYTSSLEDINTLSLFVEEADPDEVYNFTGRMFAPTSWVDPGGYFRVNTEIVSNLLHVLSAKKNIRLFNAGSGEMFRRGTITQPVLCEESVVQSNNPYALSKEVAYRAVKMYREEKGMHASTGIFFNMESPRRSTFFFAEKVCHAVVQIANGRKEPLTIGPLNAHRDWGLTREYVEAAWLMVQSDFPQDYVISTGVTKGCTHFIETALHCVGLTGHLTDYVRITPGEHNPRTFDHMYTSPKKIKECLGWEAKTKFEGVVKELVAGFQEQAKVKAAGA